MKLFKLWKKISKILLHRVVIVGVLLLLQIIWMVVNLTELAAYSPIVYNGLNILSLIAVLAVVNARDNPSYKLAWVIAI
ncbi:MAG: cardiolipin synthase, partial [Lachnospiraceae bacterium]|nr:cardiolipin synthase [Lachnospiraceae bacterium]